MYLKCWGVFIRPGLCPGSLSPLAIEFQAILAAASAAATACLPTEVRLSSLPPCRKRGRMHIVLSFWVFFCSRPLLSCWVGIFSGFAPPSLTGCFCFDHCSLGILALLPSAGWAHSGHSEILLSAQFPS